MTEVESSATGDGFVPYAAFGEEFFALAITEERVLGVVDLLAGQPIEVGPTPAGPGGLARVTASGATVVQDVLGVEAEMADALHRSGCRRGGVVHRVLQERELRRFTPAHIAREVARPHVARSLRTPLDEVMEEVWPVVAQRFSPQETDAPDATVGAAGLPHVTPSGGAR